jgi:hypothetical protein
MFKYSPPGSLDDLAGRPSRDSFLVDWHGFIEKTFGRKSSSNIWPAAYA